MKRSTSNARKFPVVALLALTSLASCEKKKTDTVTPVTDPNAAPAEVPVLRDGAGFTQKVSKMVTVTTGVNGIAGTLGVYDFNVDKSNQLNILFFTGYQSQQDYLKLYKRTVFNLGSKAEVAVADPDHMLDNSSRQTYITQVFEFLPYSASVVAFTASEYRYGYYSQGFWGASVPLTEMPMAVSSSGYGYSGGAGFYNVYTDLGTGKHYMTINTTSANPATAPYTQFEYKTPALQGTYLANFPEPRYAGQGTPLAITVCKDSVVAYKIISYISGTASGVYAKTSELTPTGLSAGEEYITSRHYNSAGSKMAMMMYGITSKQYWTYTYDFTTNTLAAGLSAADLPYSGEGSDIDMDEDGNIYYTGTAGNGTKTGVSIYKRSAAGASLVGTDDFLKFGEVAKLRYIDGKVNVIVKGKVTGTELWHQMCLITQN